MPVKKLFDSEGKQEQYNYIQDFGPMPSSPVHYSKDKKMRTFEIQYYVDEGMITAKFQGNDLILGESWLEVTRDAKDRIAPFVVIAIPMESVSWVRELE